MTNGEGNYDAWRKRDERNNTWITRLWLRAVYSPGESKVMICDVAVWLFVCLVATNMLSYLMGKLLLFNVVTSWTFTSLAVQAQGKPTLQKRLNNIWKGEHQHSGWEERPWAFGIVKHLSIYNLTCVLKWFHDKRKGTCSALLCPFGLLTFLRSQQGWKMINSLLFVTSWH